jgi:biotin carboxyl carrier protein
VIAMKYVVEVEDRTFAVEVQEGTITIDDQVHSVDLRHIEPLSLYSLLIDNLSHELYVEKGENQYAAMLRGKLYTAKVRDADTRGQDVSRADHPVAGGERSIVAPMPGLVLEVRATAGEKTQAGDVLVILESMKMEIDIRSPQDGTIQAVHVVAGDQVTQDQNLVTVSSC